MRADSGDIYLLLDNGTVIGAGLSTTGNLGYIQTVGPTELVPGYQPEWHDLPFSNVERFGLAGNGTIFVARTDGVCQAVGSNLYGQLGAGIDYTDLNYTASPQTMQFPFGVTVAAWSVTLGISGNPIAVGSDGLVYTWGNNLDGQFGNGTNVGGSTVPISANGLSGMAWCSAYGNAMWAGAAAQLFTPPLPAPVTAGARSYAQIVG